MKLYIISIQNNQNNLIEKSLIGMSNILTKTIKTLHEIIWKECNLKKYII